MPTGVLADIHLDLTALRRTLAGPLAACDDVVALGDVLDRGPGDPVETFQELRARGATVLVGNHELAYLGGPRFAGMIEDRTIAFAPKLREMVLDGDLVAATVRDGHLCIHGGVSRAFWMRHLRDTCGDDPAAVARELNRRLLTAVSTRTFAHPVFAAIDSDLPGPFWASVHEDLVDAGQLPPFNQLVGHVRSTLGTHRIAPGSVRGVLGPERDDGLLDHLVLARSAVAA